MTAPRVLVLDAYDQAGRAALVGAGGTAAGELYANVLRALVPELEVEIRHTADPGVPVPGGEELGACHGVAWTGSNLSVAAGGDVVDRQCAWVRACLAADVPAFGSCYGLQLAAVATGGECAPSPRGREFGVSRGIRLTEAGRRHPLYRGKADTFTAWTSHADEVVRVPEGATVLASNGWSAVQALLLEQGAADFWAVQYHPEYDAREVAALSHLRGPELVAQGTFATVEDVAQWREGLVRDPSPVDPDAGRLEVRNWLEHRVLPRAR